MKTELKAENRALFEAGRQGLAPTGDDRARIAHALGLNLGGGAGVSVPAAKAIAGSAAASPPIVGVSSGIVAAKWITALAVVVGVGTGGIALYRTDRAREGSQPAPSRAGAESAREPSASGARGSAPTHIAGEEPSAAVAPRAQTTPPVLTTSTAEPPRPAHVAPARRASSAPSPRATPALDVSPHSSELSSAPSRAAIVASPPEPAPSEAAFEGTTRVRVAQEAHLLREADGALRRGDLAGATRWLDEHARLFPRGVLAEERDGQRVLVLCAAGHADAARMEASRFLSAYPRSLLAERIRASCGAP
jgi:hypothetical protein